MAMIKHTQSTAESRIGSARHQILDHSHSPSPTAMPIIPQKLVQLPSTQIERLSLHTRCSQLSPAHQEAVAQRLSGMSSQPPHTVPHSIIPSCLSYCNQSGVDSHCWTLRKRCSTPAPEQRHCAPSGCSSSSSVDTKRKLLSLDRSLMRHTPNWECHLNPYLKLSLFSGNIVKSTDLLQKFSNFRADIGFLY